MGAITLVSQAISSATVNLTTTTGSAGQALEDWARFTNASNTNNWQQRRNGGGSLISNVTATGTSPESYNDDNRTISYTDGTPTGSLSNQDGMYWIIDSGDSFSFTVPAGTGARQVRIYASVFALNSRFTLSLSDASASPVTATANQSGYEQYTIVFDYSADSASQTATMTIDATGLYGGNVALQAVWLSVEESSGVTKALTGQAITSAQGALSDVVTKALTGQSATASQGSMSDVISKALTGQSSTLSQGTLADEVSKALTGQEVIVSQGTISADNGVTRALTGQAITSSLGDVSDVVSKALTGQSTSVNQSTLIETVAYSVTGQAATVSQGTFADSVSVGLIGQQINGAQGDISSNGDVTRSLSGHSITAQQGFLTVPQDNLFGGVAHFKKLSERSEKQRKLEAQERTEASTANEQYEVVQIPQEVKEIISNVAKIDNEKKQRAQLKAQLKALEIQLKQEYIDALKTEMIRNYLIVEKERQEEEETIAMMMTALV